jgi:hypothetical protein
VAVAVAGRALVGRVARTSFASHEGQSFQRRCLSPCNFPCDGRRVPSRFPAFPAFRLLAPASTAEILGCAGGAGAAVLGCWPARQQPPWARPPALLHLAQGVHGARARAGAAAAAARHLARHRLLLPHAGHAARVHEGQGGGHGLGPIRHCLPQLRSGVQPHPPRLCGLHGYASTVAASLPSSARSLRLGPG